MVLDFKVNVRLVVGMTINFFLHFSQPYFSLSGFILFAYTDNFA